MTYNKPQQVITDKNNTFFTNNKIEIATQKPNNGTYDKGDIVVNIGYNNIDEPIWICVESGEPGVWEVVGGRENIVGENIIKMVSKTNNVLLTSPSTEVNIGINDFDKEVDTLLVFKNGVHIIERIDFNISDDSSKIISLNDIWNEGNIEDYNITFIVFKNVSMTDEEISKVDLSNYQQKTDNNLQTSSKDLVGAINEVNQKVSKEVDLSPYQQKTDNNLQTENKDLVGAINELFQSANNGKELIASAIGEPLNAEDTFSAMSNDINGLLSTFKTNMMKNGVTVESGDKFKSLIDKIATMVNDKNNKIILEEQSIFTDRTGEWTIIKPGLVMTSDDPNIEYYISWEQGGPHYYKLYDEGNNVFSYHMDSENNEYVGNIESRTWGTTFDAEFVYDSTTNITTITCLAGSFFLNPPGDFILLIRKRDEYDNLRDSLADILENKGVEVSPEDDMADLITKVDSISSSGGLDIISATELPATGRENQICVITDNPTDYFSFSSIQSDLDASSPAVINGLLRPDVPDNIFGGGTVITGDKFKCRYNINQFQQDGSLKFSYIYNDGNWNEFTIVSTNMLVNGMYDVNNNFGMFKTSSSGYYWSYVSGDSLKAYRPASSYYCDIWTTSNTIMNFSGYNKVKIIAYALRRKTTTSSGSDYYSGGDIKLYQSSNSACGYSGAEGSGGTELNIIKQTSEIKLTDTPTEYIFDISSWTGEGYFGINAYTYEPSISTSAKGYYVFITDICFV